jgi:hypothetical protein
MSHPATPSIKVLAFDVFGRTARFIYRFLVFSTSQLRNTGCERLLSTVRWSTALKKGAPPPPADNYDFVAKDFPDLADQLGA